jgi:class 3 adenylate cyclase
MVVLAYIGFMASYTRADERPVFWESMQAAIVYLVPIFLNYRHRQNLACHFFCIYNLLLYTYFAISHGKVDAAEYFLLTSSVAAMLFFRKFYIVFIYFILNLGFFWVCKYSFTVMKPFVVMPAGEEAYVPNTILLFVFAFLIVHYFKVENIRQEGLLENRNERLAEEKQKSDTLLLNILPEKTADELKETGSAKARQYAMVTVMFTDFINFTKMAAMLQPAELVDMIDTYFSDFDRITSRHNIEKIKTIGDSYMCAGGLPEENVTHPADVVRAALEIQAYMENIKKEKMLRNEAWLELRLGIHTGPVIAGIVGTRKFAYDIWGDTVNTASRVETSGEAGKVNISGATHTLVKDQFHCFYRGKIPAKNKGEIEMYFVEGVFS